MRIFKRKEKPIGRGSEKTVAFDKIFNPLNYCPLAYEYTPYFKNVLSNADGDFKKRLSNVSIDDLNVDLFDPMIDSLINLEIVRAKEQYTNHVSVINHMAGLIEGELKLADEHLLNLENDKSESESEKSKLLQLKDKLNIV